MAAAMMQQGCLYDNLRYSDGAVICIGAKNWYQQCKGNTWQDPSEDTAKFGNACVNGKPAAQR
jgi:hypothetical protein